MSAQIRVALADDHPVVLAGLRSLIQLEADIDLIGEATTGVAALAIVAEMLPDVAVVDISMPNLNGLVLTNRIAKECPSVRVLILTFHEDRSYVNQALAAGARGYVLKRAAAENLILAIRAVYVGGLYLDPAIADQVFEPPRRRPGGKPEEGNLPRLTAREAEVLKLTAIGQTNKHIARQLDVSVKTVETFKSRGIEKIGLKTRADIVRYAAAQGWLADL